ncbi:hypothetical protein BLA29_004808 [Euroglyphus maynei]|uniref:Cytochrome b561 domain-containing protein n=1 Tax=Euroglyphus maynei TaxID=6958 RepID=A0A1Y3AWH1_EURMA|nr:hypothetical protein BLA29_004808 [Euroglyphus maynei]
MTKSEQPSTPTTTTTTTASDTKVKIERTTSRTGGNPKEKIKISAKLNDDQLKQDKKSQLNCGLYFILQILALVTLTLMVIWFIENFGGLSMEMTDDHIEQFFNLHPLFMVFGFIFVLANCIFTVSHFITINTICKNFIVHHNHWCRRCWFDDNILLAYEKRFSTF